LDPDAGRGWRRFPKAVVDVNRRRQLLKRHRTTRPTPERGRRDLALPRPFQVRQQPLALVIPDQPQVKPAVAGIVARGRQRQAWSVPHQFHPAVLGPPFGRSIRRHRAGV
jgi:hypothetical protein